MTSAKMDEPTNISPGNIDISDQKLIDYLTGKLPVKEKLAMDKLVAESGFMNDALEGLQKFEDTRNLTVLARQLNAGLHTHLQKKKHRRPKLQLNTEQWIYLAVILVLLLVIIGYVVIRLGLGR